MAWYDDLVRLEEEAEQQARDFSDTIRRAVNQGQMNAEETARRTLAGAYDAATAPARGAIMNVTDTVNNVTEAARQSAERAATVVKWLTVGAVVLGVLLLIGAIVWIWRLPSTVGALPPVTVAAA